MKIKPYRSSLIRFLRTCNSEVAQIPTFALANHLATSTASLLEDAPWPLTALFITLITTAIATVHGCLTPNVWESNPY